MLNNLMAYLTVRFEDLKDREEGQGMVEYALLAGLIAVVAVVAITAIGVDVDRIFTAIDTALDAATP